MTCEFDSLMHRYLTPQLTKTRILLIYFALLLIIFFFLEKSLEQIVDMGQFFEPELTFY